MKMNIHFNSLSKRIKVAAFIGVVILAVTGCKKDSPSDTGTGSSFDGSTIKFVLNDNFNFGITYGAFTYAALTDTLAKPGPYTVLAPDDNAFKLVNITEPVAAYTFQFYTKRRLVDMMRYNILPGKISFRSTPLVQNRRLLTLMGGNVYLSKYLNGTDTITTINGLKLISTDNAASNGYIQVLPQLLNVETYNKVMDYMRNDTTLTLFTEALHRASLDASLLSGNDVYTILAPSNTAMQQSAKLGLDLGVSTLDSILQADPIKLAGLLKYHLIKGRYFEGDLYRYATMHPQGIETLIGTSLGIGGDPAGFHAIKFTGTGNNGTPAAIATPKQYDPTTNNANIPCGNAVIHIIDRILIQ